MILLDSNTYYKLGRQAVLDEQFDKALGYFNKAGDYHSQLNAVVLLAYFGEFYLAHQQFVQFYASFGGTHNVNADLLWSLRGGGEKLAKSLLNGKSAKRDKAKVSAVKSKVFQYGFLTALTQEETLQQQLTEQIRELDEFCEMPLPRFTVFNSKEYFDVLTEKMRRAFIKGNVEEGTGYVKQLMESDSDVTSHLELKLMLLLAHGEQNKAYQLAQRLMDDNDVSCSGKFAIAEVFYAQADKESLRKLLQQFVNCGYQIDEVEWRKLVSLSTYVKDYKLANDFADKMEVDDYYGVNLDYLITASIAYYNYGRYDLAVDVAQRVYAVLPNNIGVRALLAYYKTNKDATVKLDVAYPQRLFTPYQVPRAVAKKSMSALQSNDYDQDSFAWHLNLLTYAENGYNVGTNRATFCTELTNFIIDTTFVTDKVLDLMKAALYNEYTSQHVKVAFLYYLTKNFTVDATVCFANGVNYVPAGCLDGVTDSQRLAFCCLLASHQFDNFDVEKAVQAFNALDEEQQSQDSFVVAEKLFCALTTTL